MLIGLLVVVLLESGQNTFDALARERWVENYQMGRAGLQK